MQWNGLKSSPCSLCPRECGADRENGQTGFCLMDDEIMVARAALHMWEEPCISGRSGSGTVFFSGCNLRCVYCQNGEISAGKKGKRVSVRRLAEIFLKLQEKGAANINLVTPDHYAAGAAKAVWLAREKGLHIPIVYNGGGYEKKEAIRALSGIVDIFLTDFKYMDSALAARYSAAPDYPAVAKLALAEMVSLTGPPVFDENGMMKKGVIVRHLLLPGHKRNAKDVLRYVYETYGDRVYLSLMNQYTPPDKLKAAPGCEEIRRRVTKREYDAVTDYAIGLGVRNAFIQEGNTAKELFIPAFDGEGV
ncbi:MAG: radical SAM protein [Blautia sp.]|nr:radical SAM protein [Blautia sp.]MCM1199748.1 radical SAM protein [Bacteroides fragilis]